MHGAAEAGCLGPHVRKAAYLAAFDFNAEKVPGIVPVRYEKHTPVIVIPAVIGKVRVLAVAFVIGKLPYRDSAYSVLETLLFRRIHQIGFQMTLLDIFIEPFIADLYLRGYGSISTPAGLEFVKRSVVAIFWRWREPNTTFPLLSSYFLLMVIFYHIWQNFTT
jgi:hypothetical protein